MKNGRRLDFGVAINCKNFRWRSCCCCVVCFCTCVCVCVWVRKSEREGGRDRHFFKKRRVFITSLFLFLWFNLREKQWNFISRAWCQFIVPLGLDRKGTTSKEGWRWEYGVNFTNTTKRSKELIFQTSTSISPLFMHDIVLNSSLLLDLKTNIFRAKVIT